MRFYGFSSSELLDSEHPNFNNIIDPKCDWALRHLELFPLEINSAPYQMLLRVPGLGIRGAQKIISARRFSKLSFNDLKKMRMSLKRAKYFITCCGKTYQGLWLRYELLTPFLLSDNQTNACGQLELFDNLPTKEDYVKCLTGEI